MGVKYDKTHSDFPQGTEENMREQRKKLSQLKKQSFRVKDRVEEDENESIEGLIIEVPSQETVIDKPDETWCIVTEDNSEQEYIEVRRIPVFDLPRPNQKYIEDMNREDLIDHAIERGLVKNVMKKLGISS